MWLHLLKTSKFLHENNKNQQHYPLPHSSSAWGQGLDLFTLGTAPVKTVLHHNYCALNNDHVWHDLEYEMVCLRI